MKNPYFITYVSSSWIKDASTAFIGTDLMIIERIRPILNNSLIHSQIAMGRDISTPTAFVTLRYSDPLSTVNDDTDQLAINKKISQCVATNLKT